MRIPVRRVLGVAIDRLDAAHLHVDDHALKDGGIVAAPSLEVRARCQYGAECRGWVDLRCRRRVGSVLEGIEFLCERLLGIALERTALRLRDCARGSERCSNEE